MSGLEKEITDLEYQFRDENLKIYLYGVINNASKHIILIKKKMDVISKKIEKLKTKLKYFKGEI